MCTCFKTALKFVFVFLFFLDVLYTPHCSYTSYLKYKLTCQFTRGAKPSVKDAGGLTVLERAMEMGAITDEQLFIMLVESR